MKPTCLYYILPALLLGASASSSATHTWKGSSASTSWGTATNWTSGVAPTAVEANVKLVFPASTFTTTVNNIPGLKVDDITITGGNYSFAATGGGTLTFTGVSAIGLNNAPPAGQTNTFESTLPVAFQGAIWRVDNGFAPLEFKGAISGTGTLKRTGAGTVTFSGSSANTFSGGLRCEGGNTFLSKPAGVFSFAGNGVNVGDPAGLVKAELFLTQSGQIPATASLTLSLKAKVTLNQSRTQTIAALNMQGGTVFIEPGATNAVLTLKGNVYSFAAGEPAVISGATLSLDKQKRTFTVDLDPVAVTQQGLTVSANILETTGGAGIIKEGAGPMLLSGNNDFDSKVMVNAGSLTAASSTALGSGLPLDEESTTVAAGARLNFATFGTVTEALFLNGGLLMEESTTVATTALTGACTVLAPSQLGANAGRTLNLKGIMAGTGNLSTSPLHHGTILFSGLQSTTWNGRFSITAGTVSLQRSSALFTDQVTVAAADPANPAKLKCLAAGQLSPTSHVTLGIYVGPDGDVYIGSPMNAEWDLGGFNVEIGGLDGVGAVKIGAGVLTLGADNKNWHFRGVMTGNSMIKKGTGSLSISPYVAGGVTTNSSLTGDTIVMGGTLFMDGDQTSHFTITSGGLLAGSGSVGMVSVGPGGNLCLCALKALGITGSGAGNGINFNLYGSNNQGHLKLTGQMQLNGTILTGTLPFLPLMGSTFTLIENDGIEPVMGIFSGLSEGATFVMNGQPFTISYHGGDGNDIVLTFTGTGPLPPTVRGMHLDESLNTVFLSGRGSPGVTYYWEASTDMKTWNYILTAIPDALGNTSGGYTTDALLPGRLFFRLTYADIYLP